MHPCSQGPSIWKMRAGLIDYRFSVSWSQVCFHFLGLVRQWWPRITNYPLLETSKGCIQITQWVRAVLNVPILSKSLMSSGISFKPQYHSLALSVNLHLRVVWLLFQRPPSLWFSCSLSIYSVTFSF